MNTGKRKEGEGGGERETEIEMKDVGARGRTEGDSGEKAGKWVRGEDKDVEEEEGESDEERWKERYQREMQEKDGEMMGWRGGDDSGLEVWRAVLPGAEN